MTDFPFFSYYPPPSGLLAGLCSPHITRRVFDAPPNLTYPKIMIGGRRRPLLPSSVRTPGWSDMRRAETSQEAGRRRVGGENGEIRQSWNYLLKLKPGSYHEIGRECRFRFRNISTFTAFQLNPNTNSTRMVAEGEDSEHHKSFKTIVNNCITLFLLKKDC